MISRESLHALEFDKVLNIISEFSNSNAARQAILDIFLLNNREDIEERFGQIKEIRRMTQEGTPLKLYRFQDISETLEQLRPEDAVLDPHELLPLIPVLRVISEISSQVKDTSGLPRLKELASDLTGFPQILLAIQEAIDEEGNILDSASPMLFQLRARIRSLETKIKKRLEETVRDIRITPFLQDDFITKRAGRWVIPVRMDSKGQVPGVVHDISRSGETAFIEPLEIIGAANEVENLIAEEKAEEIRILKNICRMIREVADAVELQYRTIVYLDVLNSIARFADFLQLNIPRINNSSQIKLVEARHPLLLLAQKRHKFKEVVPLDLTLGGNYKVAVITGPNAGGKTVAIKTVGLLLLMALSGIPVSADSSSTFPLASKLLLDIGDEQSIENSLSTFSAHVFNISEILRMADSGAVILLDELGTGTDPVEGAALSCAVLRDLKEKGALVFATTHLTDIVGFVYRTEGMINASMEFNLDTLAPLYRLRMGEPGQAHALEIAKRYGLTDNIIKYAKELLGDRNVEFRELLAELREKRMLYEELSNELQRQRVEFEEKERFLKESRAEMEGLKTDMLKKAYQEAQDIILETKRQVFAILEKAKKKKRPDAMKHIVKIQEAIGKRLMEFQSEPSLSMSEIKEGDVVFVKSVGYDATVLRTDLRHNRLRVKTGIRELEVSLLDISPKKGRTPEIKPDADPVEKMEDMVTSKINVIGLRVDEALSKLEPFLNHALLAGLSEVTVIHGIGTGALLKAVRSHLTGHPLVGQFRDGEPSEGGKGVTVVTLK